MMPYLARVNMNAIHEAIKKLRTENALLTAKNERLLAENSQTYCAHCGQSFVRDDGSASLVGEHIRVCAKHPMRAVEAENKRLQKELEMLKDAFTACDNNIFALKEEGEYNARQLLILRIIHQAEVERLRKALETIQALIYNAEDANGFLVTAIIVEVDKVLRGEE